MGKLDLGFKMPKPNRIHKKLMLSYFIDWILLALIGAGLLVLALLAPPPRKTAFSLLDPKIHYPYHSNEIISIWFLGAFAIAVPMVTSAIICIFGIGNTSLGASGRSWRAKVQDVHGVWLGLWYSIIFSRIIHQGLSLFSAQTRPDLIARCQPPQSAYLDQNIMLFQAGMVNSSICTQTDVKLLDQGFTSFPSGHCTTGFAGLAFLSYFLALRISLIHPHSDPYNTSTRASGRFTTVLVVLLPLILASLISISRILDNRHHPFDVVAGSLFGIGCAYAAYRLVLLPNALFEREIYALRVRNQLGISTQYSETMPLTGIYATKAALAMRTRDEDAS